MEVDFGDIGREALTVRIRRDAGRVGRLLVDLETMKFSGSRVLSERVMRPIFESRVPGNQTVTDATLLVEIRLGEWVRHLRNDVEPGKALGSNPVDWCRWVEFNSALIADHVEGELFAVALEEMGRILLTAFEQAGGGDAEERRVLVKTAAMKVGVETKVIKRLVRSGRISSTHNKKGLLLVLMSEVSRELEGPAR